MNIKEIFAKAETEDGKITYEQFEELAKANEAKFADLSEGKYVSKSKYDSDLKAVNTQMDGLNEQITTLNETITTRDTDLAGLQKQLEDAGQDATKLADVTAQFTAFQQKYTDDMNAYQSQIKQQAYEFAVKEFANTKKFTSQAAKRDFIQAMTARGLQMEGDKLIGGDDFVELYSADNADAFYVEPEPTPAPPIEEPAPAKEEPKPQEPVPTITASATGANSDVNDNNGFNFNFVGVRSK